MAWEPILNEKVCPKKLHAVTFTDQMIEILEVAGSFTLDTGLIFPSQIKRKALSNNTLPPRSIAKVAKAWGQKYCHIYDLILACASLPRVVVCQASLDSMKFV